jgi:protein-tyrosine kinase
MPMSGRARLHEVLGTPLGPGLIDLLLVDGSLDVERRDVAHGRSQACDLIPMGRFHSHANELLASENMRRANSTELETRYKDRVVIFDSPPILSTSDPVVLSGIGGANRVRGGGRFDTAGGRDRTRCP